jgi:hypothetical protein
MRLEPNLQTFTPSELQCAEAMRQAAAQKQRKLPELTPSQARCYSSSHRSECPVCRPELDG